MKRKNATRNALFMSIISLVLCVSMLVGTTFAWFTDSVESGINVIAAGNLDIELYHTNKNDIDEKVTENVTLFDDVTLWEPGAVLFETLKVVNEGTLALKYNLNLNVLEETVVDGNKLSDVIMVGKIDSALGTGTTREGLVGAVTEWTPLNAFSMKENAVELEVDGSDEFTVVLYWKPNTNNIDNRYNVKDKALNVKIGVVLTATQVEAESDSFGDDYDSAAKVPGSATSTTRTPVNSDGSVSLTVINAPAADTKRTTVDAPAGAFTAGDEVEIEVTTVNTLFNVTAEGGSVAALDVTLSVNGTEVTTALADGKVYTVTTYISKNLTDVKVDYTGTDGKDEPTLVSYDAETGKLVFTTNHFSNYAVYGSALAYDTKNDTAVNDVETIVEAAKDNESTVIIPDANKTVVTEKIDEAVKNGTITEDDKNVIDNALVNVVMIGEKSYATLAEAFAAAEDNQTITLMKDVYVDADTTINVAKNIILNLNGKTLAGASNETGKNKTIIVATKDGDLTVKDGTVTMEHIGANMGWNNSTQALEAVSGGKLTLDNVHVKNLGGSDMAYAVNIANNGGATLKTIASTLESVNYNALRIFNNADGAINVDLTNGSKLTGSGSPFWVHFWTEADCGSAEKAAARQACLNVNFNDTQVTRYSGSKSLFRFGFTGAIYYSDSALTEVVAGNADALVWALENGKNVLLNNDIKIDPANMSNAYGKTGINVKNGQTIDGGSNVLDIKGAGGTWDSGINTTGGLIQNITVTGSFRGIFINHNSTHSEPVVLKNVVIDGTTYTISCDQGMNQNLEAYNSTFNGWTSYAATIGTVKFDNCSFGEGNGYAFCRPYAPTEFVGCDFEEGFELDPRAAVTFENCTIGGVALTAENLATLVTSNIANATVK